MKKQAGLTGILLLVVISALVYLPLVRSFGYYNDDWYLMYAAGAHGPGVFWEIFSVDRPARALVMIPAYGLFGENVLLYNLSAYLFRVISAISLFWLLGMLWPRQRIPAFLAALLFLLYPGFLSQANGIDYQSQMVSLAAALLSIAMSVKAALLQNRVQKILLILAAVLLGWLYLALVEYFIGFEVLRLGCFYVLENRSRRPFKEKARAVFRTWLPYSIIPLGFLAWRLFFFESERGATDVDLQLGLFRQYPIQTLYHWTVQVVQDLFDVMLSAWVVPLSQLTGAIQLRSVILGLLIVGLIVVWLYRAERAPVEDAAESSDGNLEFLLLGLLLAITGLIPIAMVNREVAFPAFSRYSLVSAAGVAMVIVILARFIRWRMAGYAVLGILLFISILTHHANSVRLARETTAARNFWWQVAWRIPQLEPRTTLVGSYPGGVIEEDYFIWGPANLIYYPREQLGEGIQPTLFAALLSRDTVDKVLARDRQEYDKRKNIITYKNYRNILILSQPSPHSCVHVIDGRQPYLSKEELESIREIAPFSEIEHILPDEVPPAPPEIVFGPEPDRDWCYYFQKADLARQRGDWEAVLALGREASANALAPADPIEWLPFLQAYAKTADLEALTELAPQLTADAYISGQACQIIKSMPDLSASVIETINSLYCKE